MAEQKIRSVFIPSLYLSCNFWSLGFLSLLHSVYSFQCDQFYGATEPYFLYNIIE